MFSETGVKSMLCLGEATSGARNVIDKIGRGAHEYLSHLEGLLESMQKVRSVRTRVTSPLVAGKSS